MNPQAYRNQWRHPQPRLLPLLLLAFLACLPLASARTIILEGDQIDRLAGLDAGAPKISMALGQTWGEVRVAHEVRITTERRIFMRWSLAAIPPKQKIAHAELILDVGVVAGKEPRLYLWRGVADWGLGACYDYRLLQDGKKLPWARPGAGGIGLDRAVRPTGIARLEGPGEQIINVTEDVELWYSGAVNNNGWLLSVEDPGVIVVMSSPLWVGAPRWRLRITYEPE